MHEEIQQYLTKRNNFESMISSIIQDYRNEVHAYLSDKIVGKQVMFQLEDGINPAGILTRIVTMSYNTIYVEIEYSGNRLYQTDIKYVTFL